ncbi:DUF3349 domain-containing protein [Luteococcus sediminum]|uniref:DUF3349 domain-containing protein n=1 Tax=Luteococcus sp. TaxID=1969402 RepID=UPI0037364AA0
MFTYLERAVEWLKAGYPQGIPANDYIPLVAVLRRKLTDEEIEQLGRELSNQGLVPADRIDVGTGYLRITDELPSVQELRRITEHLRRSGWEIEDDAWRTVPGSGVG